MPTLIRTKHDTCHCDAYRFPHRRGGGFCGGCETCGGEKRVTVGRSWDGDYIEGPCPDCCGYDGPDTWDESER